MAASLGLVQNHSPLIEKRLLPRHTFAYLLFKLEFPAATLAVADISAQGMQIQGRSDLAFTVGQKVQGHLAWDGKKMLLTGEVTWVQQSSCGIRFTWQDASAQEFQEFFAAAAVAEHLRPVRIAEEEGLANLKYWLHAGKAAEIFIWQHPTGQIAKIQVIYLGDLVEWEDGVGISTGKISGVQNTDTPLSPRETLAVEIDAQVDAAKLAAASTLVAHLKPALLPKEVQEFCQVKLR
jgi:hypothetical protein